MTSSESELMADQQHTEDACPISQSLAILEQKWTFLIIREALKGARRFSEFEQTLRCPRNLLASRLRLLRDHGILRAVRYEMPGQRAREHYELTLAGQQLAPTLIALFDWGTEHASTGDVSWTEPSHCRCGARIRTVLECEAGHDNHSIDDIVFPRGPVVAIH